MLKHVALEAVQSSSIIRTGSQKSSSAWKKSQIFITFQKGGRLGVIRIFCGVVMMDFIQQVWQQRRRTSWIQLIPFESWYLEHANPTNEILSCESLRVLWDHGALQMWLINKEIAVMTFFQREAIFFILRQFPRGKCLVSVDMFSSPAFPIIFSLPNCKKKKAMKTIIYF